LLALREFVAGEAVRLLTVEAIAGKIERLRRSPAGPVQDPPTALVMAGFDQTGGHLQGRKQGCRAMTFVLMVEAGDPLACPAIRGKTFP